MSDKVVSLEQIHFTNKKQQELYQEARFGQDVYEFLHTDVGRYLRGVAEQEMEICRQKMADLSPGDPKFKNKFAKLKFDYEVAKRFTMWLGQAIAAGCEAENQIENEEY